MSTENITVKPINKSNSTTNSNSFLPTDIISTVDSEINELVKNARCAYEDFLTFDQATRPSLKSFEWYMNTTPNSEIASETSSPSSHEL